jgi:hypothetical protein
LEAPELKPLLTNVVNIPLPLPSVTAVTQETNQIKPGLIKLPIGSQDGTNCNIEIEPGEWDNGTSVTIKSFDLEQIGKLCKWVLVLIKYKVSADGAVSDCMVQVLGSVAAQLRYLYIYRATPVVETLSSIYSHSSTHFAPPLATSPLVV